MKDRLHKVTLPNNPNESGTSLQGYVSATYDQLCQAFGQPDGPSYDGKVLHTWRRDIDGVLCVIYDYKEDLNNGKPGDWHIGGKFLACAQLVNEALAERL